MAAAALSVVALMTFIAGGPASVDGSITGDGVVRRSSSGTPSAASGPGHRWAQGAGGPDLHDAGRRARGAAHDRSGAAAGRGAPSSRPMRPPPVRSRRPRRAPTHRRRHRGPVRPTTGSGRPGRSRRPRRSPRASPPTSPKPVPSGKPTSPGIRRSRPASRRGPRPGQPAESPTDRNPFGGVGVGRHTGCCRALPHAAASDTSEQRGSEPPQGGDRFRHWSAGHGEAGRGRTVISSTIRANQ